MSQSPIPIVDLAAFSSASTAERARVVAQVKTALEDVGFLMITGHGVEPSLIDRASKASLDFFDLPAEEKMKCLPSKPGSRGYNEMRGRTVGIAQNPSLLRSLQESFAVGRIDVPDDPFFRAKEAGHTFAPNIWPEAPTGFKEAMSDYWYAMDRTYRKIMSLLAVALDQPADYFDPMIDKHGSLLRLTHYPSLDAEPLPGEYRSGAHTDGGAITILHIDDTPDALQVKLRSGEWVFVNQVPGAFIINVGDMLMRWSNDKWLSNWHQVVNPPFVDGKSNRRLSLVYFCSTNHDTIVQCLPNCSGPGNPARYPPILSRQYAAERFDLRYGITKPEAKSA
jgi:isopenicillin N synthase-like dioxygenase